MHQKFDTQAQLLEARHDSRDLDKDGCMHLDEWLSYHKDRFAHIDANGDCISTPAERGNAYKADLSALKEADANQDNVISPGEVDDLLRSGKACNSCNDAGIEIGLRAMSLEEIAEKLDEMERQDEGRIHLRDTDGDGQISCEDEEAFARTRFKNMDADGSNCIEKGEYAQLIQKKKGALEDADTDKSGHIDRDEVSAHESTSSLASTPRRRNNR